MPIFLDALKEAGHRTIHRYDVVFSKRGCDIEFHFCREWDGEEGCYGTNPDHGLSFEEAIKEIANHYQVLAKYWLNMNERDFFKSQGALDTEK